MGDVGLAAAMERLVEASLGVVPGDSVVVVHDEAHDDVAAAIADAVAVAKGQCALHRLEDHGPRPHAKLPATVVEALAEAQVSVLVVDFHANELRMRTELVDLAARHGLRHGHVVGVQRASLVAGLSVHPQRIAEKARSLLVRLGPTSRIAVRCPSGSDLVAELEPRCRWLDFGATVLSGRRVNLPGGELVTSPGPVTGTYVAAGTLGDADGALRRSLRDTPVALRITRSRVVGVECPRDPSLARAILARMGATPNLDRVGLLGFGVNIGLLAPMGDVFTDQKVPGVHLSLGESFPDRTGATWTSTSWLGFTGIEQDVDVDRTPAMRFGRYLV